MPVKLSSPKTKKKKLEFTWDYQLVTLLLFTRVTLTSHYLCVLQDRADRAARYAKTQEEERAAKEALLQARQAEQEARKEALLRERR